MNNTKNIKTSLYSAYIILHTLIMLCIAACTQQPDTNGKAPQSEGLKDTSTKRSSHSAVEPSAPLTSVESIQTSYSNIVSKAAGGRLDSISFKYSCHGEKSGTVTYFTEKGQLRLIVHRYNEYDHYSAVDRYFVKDSTLFFAITNSVTWAFEDGPEGATIDNISEKRVYLVSGQPIRCLEKKFSVRSQAKDNPSSETVPNREVECPAAGTVMKPFLLLTKYRSKPTLGCLD
jgi:hypothetical protein